MPKIALQLQGEFLTGKNRPSKAKGVFDGEKTPFNLKGDFLVSFFPLYGILHVILFLKGVF